MDASHSSADRIELDLPAGTRYASTARAVVAALAADAGFSIDDIEDLRLAVDEAISVVCDRAEGGARLHLGFSRTARQVTATVALVDETSGGQVDGTVALDPLAERILGAVVDSFSIDHGVFTLVKSTSA